jgi:hypothetical protein
MATFKFYSDINLTTAITGNVAIGEGSVVNVFYLGSTDSTKKLQDSTNPGVTPMEVSIVDANPGSGPTTAWVKLALSSGGLSSAVAGDPLVIGTTVLGGNANCLPIWVQIDNSLSGSSSSTDLSIQITDVKEFSV